MTATSLRPSKEKQFVYYIQTNSLDCITEVDDVVPISSPDGSGEPVYIKVTSSRVVGCHLIGRKNFLEIFVIVTGRLYTPPTMTPSRLHVADFYRKNLTDFKEFAFVYRISLTNTTRDNWCDQTQAIQKERTPNGAEFDDITQVDLVQIPTKEWRRCVCGCLCECPFWCRSEQNTVNGKNNYRDLFMDPFINMKTLHSFKPSNTTTTSTTGNKNENKNPPASSCFLPVWKTCFFCKLFKSTSTDKEDDNDPDSPCCRDFLSVMNKIDGFQHVKNLYTSGVEDTKFY